MTDRARMELVAELVKAHGVVISAVTAQVACGFTILPGLLGKIGTRLHPGCPGYLYSQKHQ